MMNERTEDDQAVSTAGLAEASRRFVAAGAGPGGRSSQQAPGTVKPDGTSRRAVPALPDIRLVAPEATPEAPRGQGETDEADRTERPVPATGDAMRRILDRLRRRFGLDFGLYEASAIGRRIRRRAELRGRPELDDYARLIQGDEVELDQLCDDLLVGVTTFFRDAEAFAALDRRFLEPRLDDMRPDRPIRIWVPGCATGEEAYSIAMLLAERAAERRLEPSFKIFATDIHRRSLEAAACGSYSVESVRDLSPALVDRYFEPIGNRLQIRPGLRRHLLFSRHDLLQDPPFTRLDLISCRNILIHLCTPAQRRTMGLFLFALDADGGLFLGPGETPGEFGGHFRPLDQRWRLFAKLPAQALAGRRQPAAPGLPNDVATMQWTAFDRCHLLPAYDRLLARYAPPSLLVDRSGVVLHVFGDAQRFLRLRDGLFSQRLVDLVEDELRVVVGDTLERCLRLDAEVVARPVALPDRVHGEDTSVVVSIEPLGSDPARMPYLTVAFDTLPASVAPERAAAPPDDPEMVDEEPQTAETEQQRRIVELTPLESEMDELWRSPRIGTILLDAELRIRRFTPAAGELFNLLPHDCGRPLADVACRFADDGLHQDMAAVLGGARPIERALLPVDGRIRLTSIQPFLANCSRIEGLVLTFVDVKAPRRAEAETPGLQPASADRSRHQRAPSQQTAQEQANLELAFAIGGMSYVAIDIARGLIDGGPLLARLLGERPGEGGWPLDAFLAVLEDADADRLRGLFRHSDGPELAIDEELALLEHEDLLAVRLVGRLRHEEGPLLAGILADITERRRGEDLSNRRAADLAAVNRQLEQFTHLVSHDLKSPLRGVHHIASFLRDDLGDAASPEVLQHLDRLERQIAKMSRMLDDLQAYAHADRTAGRGEMVDIAALVVELGELLGVPDGIRLEVDAEPSRITTDRTALALVLRNLVDNGVKHHDGEAGRIIVRARREARGRMRFLVADDGPGIAPAQRKQVFELFRTTGGKGDGSGMGLAFVRRAVQRHGGRIWIEDAPAGLAAPGRGVAFVFNWPLHAERASGRRSR